MGLLVFAIVFCLCNIVLYLLGNVRLPKENDGINIAYMRGTIRGCEGRFDTFDGLELMRKRVNRKKSKF
jgi:hypothetical protein